MENMMKVTFPGGKQVYADYKGFTIKTDQPVYQGGEGLAPAPFDLFLASYATCAAVYVLSFLENRKISAQDAEVYLKTQKSSETKMIEKITIDVLLPPECPEKYKNAVIKAVNICTVKQHILNPPEFETTVTIKSP